MNITFDITDLEALTVPETNTVLIQKLEALGHTLDPEILKIIRHPSSSEKLKQDAWKYIFRSIGVIKLETRRVEDEGCHRFTLHFPEKPTAP